MSTPFSPDQSPHVEALRGLALTSDVVGYSADPVFAWNRDRDPARRVVLASGGGAGHEPMHAGFLGRGGLDVAVPGEVFTSPHNGQIVAGVQQVARSGDEVLLIVKNYTGDVINFAIAAERLTADGCRVATVLVEDDLGSEGAAVGRRGTGATVVIEKILGAAADAGDGLEELQRLGEAVAERSRSLAVARASHTRPGGGAGFEVGDGLLEYGVGIHGETAAETIEDPGLEALVERMVNELLDALGEAEHGHLVMVNGLGGVSNLELAHISARVAEVMADRDAPVASLVSGTFISALDMRGFSITVTAVDDPGWIDHWLAPHATALPRPVAAGVVEPHQGATDESAGSRESSAWLDDLAEQFAALRDPLNALDQRTGDGDLGTNIAQGLSRAARRGGGDLGSELASMAGAFLDEVGGSSGPLFGLVLSEIARTAGDGAGPRDLGRGLRSGVEAVRRVGGAEPGDRTMVDALAPAAEREALDAEAVAAAVEGAESTRTMTARRGRASYLGERVLGTPDPGAVAAALLLRSIAERSGADLGDLDTAALLD
ncbi:dihydroxyacetone kinase subunit DhaK [Aeromicrobium piscarium]|uniref:DAK2 domain-containing protein n=1 Tax=Aeromicrobium piscarium TaxID=2590901 RepID=A0A554S8N8_9ACTN|nr:dihydroxyacetone kinase subunit DhaK [Aeromicrobium piscarium]TSD62720.1 DAK2 domain-containing protein [Aeromicrobium piscarium]